MEINREHFEHWLFSQKPDRQFNYFQGYRDDPIGCLVCNFFREATGIKQTATGIDNWSERGMDGGTVLHKMPEWLTELTRCVPLTIGECRRRYLELFPDTELEPTKTIVAELTELPVE